ncbi:MAG: terminase small subunit [Ruminococcus sp.]|nr:terminase small subunit [Ruminococcus sp.]
MKTIDIKDFVLAFVRGGNAEEAAVSAGVAPIRARLDGLRLLSRRSVRRRVERARREAFSQEAEIRAGLERLAYGRVNDAAALAFSDEITPAMLASADLYNVSEIKRVKGGGVEIKFYDRQKALERLAELNDREQTDRKARSLVEAIYGSAPAEGAVPDAVSGDDEDEDDLSGED